MLVRNCKPVEHLKCDMRTWVQLTRSWVAQKCPFYRLGGSWWAAPSLLLGAPNKLHSSCISIATPHQPASIKWGPFGWRSGVRHSRGLTWLGYRYRCACVFFKTKCWFLFPGILISNSSSHWFLAFLFLFFYYFLGGWGGSISCVSSPSTPSLVSIWIRMPCVNWLGMCFFSVIPITDYWRHSFKREASALTSVFIQPHTQLQREASCQCWGLTPFVCSPKTN